MLLMLLMQNAKGPRVPRVITPDYANAAAAAPGPQFFVRPKMVLSIMRSALANLHPANLCMVQ